MFRNIVQRADNENKPESLEALGGDGWQVGIFGGGNTHVGFSLEDGIF